MNTLKQLENELARLRYQRNITEMSDDFAYTNGSIRAIDKAISEVRKQLDLVRSTMNKEAA